jgi:hypothetical protein
MAALIETRRALAGTRDLIWCVSVCALVGCGHHPSGKTTLLGDMSSSGGAVDLLSARDLLRPPGVGQDGPSPSACAPDGWCSVSPTTMPPNEDLSSVWGSSRTDVWVVGAGPSWHWDGEQWGIRDPGQALAQVWVDRSGSPIWAVSGTLVYQWGGSAWSVDPTFPVPEAYRMQLWGSGRNDVWIVGNKSVAGIDYSYSEHWDGTKWSPPNGGGTGSSLDVWGFGPDDVWFTAALGHVTQYSHGQYVDHNIGNGAPANPVAVWGAADNDLWAVGDNGSIIPQSTGMLWHWSGTDWKTYDMVTTVQLKAVWGSASNDVWAVGDFGTILHWDGQAWALQQKDTGTRFEAVWGTAKDDVWIVGAPAVILHRTQAP